jgi:hypothetical protein
VPAHAGDVSKVREQPGRRFAVVFPNPVARDEYREPGDSRGPPIRELDLEESPESRDRIQGIVIPITGK